jgi:hypothetical protein
MISRAKLQKYTSATHAAAMYMMRTGCTPIIGLQYAGSKIGITNESEMDEFVSFGKKLLFKWYEIT